MNFGHLRLIECFPATLGLFADGAEYRVSGDWTLNSHDEVRWVPLENLLDYDLAPADIPIAGYLKEAT